jgi:pimeloyl-ACP methyl ester carboxylesterase
MGAMATPVPAPRLRGREADLDHLRRVVGDRRLNYLGESTGTLIGLTYANLFPRKVRAVVLDGVEDPVRWMAGTGLGPGPELHRHRPDLGAVPGPVRGRRAS